MEFTFYLLIISTIFLMIVATISSIFVMNVEHRMRMKRLQGIIDRSLETLEGKDNG